jgi:DNA-3-methyladenine glycosylase
MPKLPFSFYQSDDVNDLAIRLLGKKLVTVVDGVLTAGVIVETEAYKGIEDKASHAFGGRLTNRTQTMYEPGGITYVYLCYGIHSLINVVTGPEFTPHAVLIRGLEPTHGVEVMLLRRHMASLQPRITAGPGALSKALGIDRGLNGKDLSGEEIWIEDYDQPYHSGEIITSPRIGVSYAQDHALLPWRYYYKGNKFVSKPHL